MWRRKAFAFRFGRWLCVPATWDSCRLCISWQTCDGVLSVKSISSFALIQVSGFCYDKNDTAIRRYVLVALS